MLFEYMVASLSTLERAGYVSLCSSGELTSPLIKQRGLMDVGGKV